MHAMAVHPDLIRTRLFYRPAAAAPGSPWRSNTWDWVPTSVAGGLGAALILESQLNLHFIATPVLSSLPPTHSVDVTPAEYLMRMVSIMRGAQGDYGWLDIEYGDNYSQIGQKRQQQIIDLANFGPVGTTTITSPQVCVLLDKRNDPGVAYGTNPNVKVRHQIGRDFVAQPATTLISTINGGVAPSSDMNSWVIAYNATFQSGATPAPTGVGLPAVAGAARLLPAVTVKQATLPVGYALVHRVGVDPLVGTQRRRVRRTQTFFVNPVN